LDARVRALVATKGGHADLELVRRIAPAFEAHRDHPVPLLVAASKHAGLVVVGSRGLRGLRALGSVSERVGHHAESPVLVVRNEDHRKGAAR
jgi:nucleotide-binding universal stress UspA family protein